MDNRRCLYTAIIIPCVEKHIKRKCETKKKVAENL